MQSNWKKKTILAGIYLLKVNNRNTRTRCEICSKLTIKIPERRQWRLGILAVPTVFWTIHLDLETGSILIFLSDKCVC